MQLKHIHFAEIVDFPIWIYFKSFTFLPHRLVVHGLKDV